MVQKELTTTSASGLELFVKSWQGDLTPKAVVILVHGFGEHCSRYTPYVDYFTKEHIAFVGYDQVGHGKSGGTRGCIQSYQQLLDDVEKIIALAEKQFPSIPNFIYGHSMGGNIALNFLLQTEHQLKGAIITSPWLKLSNEKPAIMNNMVAGLQPILPNLTVDSGLDSNLISTIKEEVQVYKTDPLNHGRISLRLAHNITKQGVWALNNTNQLKVPVLLSHGSADQITSAKASAQAAENNKQLIEFVEFPDMYHELHNDTVRENLAEKCIEFIKNQL